MTNLKIWTAEPAGDDLEHQTDVVLRLTLPNGGQYCHRYAVDPRRGDAMLIAEMPNVVKSMDDTLNMLLERWVD